MAYLFRPPTAHVRVNVDDFLFGRLLVPRGVSLLKVDGLYRQVQQPADEDLAAADLVYLGGHTYLVSNAEATALTEAGYGAGLSNLPGAGYGSGGYGQFGYGAGDTEAAVDVTGYGMGFYGSIPYGE